MHSIEGLFRVLLHPSSSLPVNQLEALKFTLLDDLTQKQLNQLERRIKKLPVFFGHL